MYICIVLFICCLLYNRRIVSICLLAFAGFLRSAEIIHISRSDILFYKSHMVIFIEKSKTDIYRDGAWLVISRTDSKLCAVACVERYLQAASIHPDCDQYIFRNVSKCRSGYVLRKDNAPLSYTRLRELFIDALTPFVDNIKKYGLHSLRSGGATAAGNNGIPDRMFKRHGRWRSENAKDGYIKDSIDNRMKVSLSLGL
ncbi:integrase/recombinase xerD homolog [Haliotis cracherodii]|uniref:integrase/recombinase xerD homolog n=1 Tax=Haliotis cracherodii TaxID=6455 RepID=UPI0039E9A81B